MQNGYITPRRPVVIGPVSALDYLLRTRKMDARSIRILLRKYLTERPRNTTEISQWINHRNGTNPIDFDLARMLESDASIVRIGRVRKSGMIEHESPLSEWATEEWVAHHERNQSVKKE